ncbi:hypothetical protein SAMN05216486_10730 [bacterium JGI 053]|nr:hypothetical protein SAMN05216486_10730 [bacterium JGI 053]
MSTTAAEERARHSRSVGSAPILESVFFKYMLVICCAVAACVVVRFESLAALGVPRMLGAIGITFAIMSALFAFSHVVAVRVLRVRRKQQMDATAVWLSRYYRQLLDETTLNPLRRHP